MQENQQQDRSAEILATLQRIQELTAQSVQMQTRQLENQETVIQRATQQLENQDLIMQKTEQQYENAVQLAVRLETFQLEAQARAKKAINITYVLITFLAMILIIRLFG